MHNFDSGVFLHTPAWHGLGKVVTQEMTIREAINYANLNWTVSKQQLFRKHPESGKIQEVQDYQALVRDDTNFQLGICHSSYKILQNQTAFEWIEPFVEEGSLVIDAAISLLKGKHVAITLRLNVEPEEIVKDDFIVPYLIFRSSHDTTLAASVIFAPVRVVCSNTLSYAFAGAENGESEIYDKRYFKIPHRGDMETKLWEAKDLIDFHKREFITGSEVLQYMSKYSMSSMQVEEYLTLTFAKQLKSKEKMMQKEGKKKPTIWDLAIVKRIMEAYEEEDSQQEIQGTMYGVVQAVSFAVTHSTHHKAKSSQLFGSGQSILSNSVKQAVAFMR